MNSKTTVLWHETMNLFGSGEMVCNVEKTKIYEKKIENVNHLFFLCFCAVFVGIIHHIISHAGTQNAMESNSFDK